MEWINTKYSLPETHGIVMLKIKDGIELKAYFHKDRMGWLNFYGIKTSYFQDKKTAKFLDDDIVTHWMELPKPPKE